MDSLLFITKGVFCFSKMAKFYHYAYFKVNAVPIAIVTQLANLTQQFNHKTSHQLSKW